MKLSGMTMRVAAALLLAVALQAGSPVHAEPLAHERAFADAELADAMMTSVTGGAQGLPRMDQITAAAIAADILAGNYGSASERARNYAISKGVAATLGTTASGFLAAVSAGEALGVRAQEHFGRGRLNALYTNLSGDTPPASWPASYGEALNDDFLGQRIDAAILPVAHWLRRRSGQTGSDRHFAELAYDMMIARRDFEQGCARYGLSGTDCTPDRLADEEAWHLETIARTHAAEHAADLRLLEIARLSREEAEANRARERAERALREAEAQEAELAREAELAAERAAEEAEAAAERAEAAREALAALRAEHEIAPPPALPPSAVSAAILDTEISDNRTLYRVRLTNTSSEPIFGLSADARMSSPASDAGVAIASGGELRTLAPGESVEVSFTGDGALDAVRLYVTGAGQLLGSFDYPMQHESAAPEEETAGDDWISVPAVYRGTVTTRSSASMDEQLFPDLQNISTQQICEIELHIDSNGRATFYHAECDTNFYQVTEFQADPNYDRYYLIFRERTGHQQAYTREFQVNVVRGRFRASELIDESMPTRTPESYVQFNNSRIDWHIEGTTRSNRQDWEGMKWWTWHLIHSMSLQRENN